MLIHRWLAGTFAIITLGTLLQGTGIALEPGAENEPSQSSANGGTSGSSDPKGQTVEDAKPKTPSERLLDIITDYELLQNAFYNHDPKKSVLEQETLPMCVIDWLALATHEPFDQRVALGFLMVHGNIDQEELRENLLRLQPEMESFQNEMVVRLLAKHPDYVQSFLKIHKTTFTSNLKESTALGSDLLVKYATPERASLVAIIYSDLKRHTTSEVVATRTKLRDQIRQVVNADPKLVDTSTSVLQLADSLRKSHDSVFAKLREAQKHGEQSSEKPSDPSTKLELKTQSSPGSKNQLNQTKPVDLVVRLPGDALLELEGLPTDQRGDVRRFQTPPIVVGQEFSYRLKASWKEDGQDRVVDRKVRLRAGDKVEIDVRRPPDWPKYSGELAGAQEVRVKNPNAFNVTVGLRSDGKGMDFTVKANDTQSVSVSNGRYDIYFQYSTDPDGLYQGDNFTLNNNGVEIQIVKVVNGNYGIKKVK